MNYVATENELDDGWPSAYVHKPGVPAKVQAAMQFVHMTCAGPGLGMMAPGDVPTAPRRKSEGEGMALEAAFMVIRHYFTGEMTYEDEPRIYELPAPKHPVYATTLPPHVAAPHKKAGP